MFDADSENHNAAEQLARDGVRPLRAGDALDKHGLESLLSSARHELGSPLQSIHGFAELLSTEAFGVLNQEQRNFVAHILTAGSDLRCAMDACVELAQLELVGHPVSARRVDLHATLSDALEQLRGPSGITGRLAANPRSASVKLDRDLFRRALETLLIGLSVRDARSFDVAFECDAEYALVSVARTARHARPETVSLPALAASRHVVRNLLWFRLAAALLAAQGANLSLAESLDYAEVRVRLSPTH